MNEKKNKSNEGKRKNNSSESDRNRRFGSRSIIEVISMIMEIVRARKPIVIRIRTSISTMTRSTRIRSMQTSTIR